jgi:3-dehydroquinate synthetase
MGKDKKSRSGAQRFIVMNSLGSAEVRSGIASELVESSLREIGGK